MFWFFVVGMALAAIFIFSPTPWRGKSQAASAFYFWRTTWTGHPELIKTLQETNTQKLYVRYFDVALDESRAAVPVAPISFGAALPVGMEVIPVVYLKNEVFSDISKTSSNTLAESVWRKIKLMSAAQSVIFKEVQIDCDWTLTTRDRFFEFMARINSLAHEYRSKLSATIRLHQIKYHRTTGIPPVDRGMVMFYNMGKIADSTKRSSIFNEEDALKYVASIKTYPLALDVALPIFTWAVHVRGGHVVALLQDIELDEVASNPDFTKSKEGLFTASRDHFFSGIYFRSGEQIQFDAMSKEQTEQAAKLVASYAPRENGFKTVAFFDLNERNIKNYGWSHFEKILRRF
jgi:hypothetical protein